MKGFWEKRFYSLPFVATSTLHVSLQCRHDLKRCIYLPPRWSGKKICPQSHSSGISPTFIHGWQNVKNIVLDLNLILCTCNPRQFFFLSRTRLALLAVEWHLAHISGMVKFQNILHCLQLHSKANFIPLSHSTGITRTRVAHCPHSGWQNCKTSYLT